MPRFVFIPIFISVRPVRLGDNRDTLAEREHLEGEKVKRSIGYEVESVF